MYLVELDYIFTRLIPRISRLVSGGPFHRPTEYQRFRPLILCACPYRLRPSKKDEGQRVWGECLRVTYLFIFLKMGGPFASRIGGQCVARDRVYYAVRRPHNNKKKKSPPPPPPPPPPPFSFYLYLAYLVPLSVLRYPSLRVRGPPSPFMGYPVLFIFIKIQNCKGYSPFSPSLKAARRLS